MKPEFGLNCRVIAEATIEPAGQVPAAHDLELRRGEDVVVAARCAARVVRDGPAASGFVSGAIGVAHVLVLEDAPLGLAPAELVLPRPGIGPAAIDFELRLRLVLLDRRVEVPAEDSRTGSIAHDTPVNGLEVVDLEKSIADTGRKVRAMDVDLAAVEAHPAGHVLFGKAKPRLVRIAVGQPGDRRQGMLGRNDVEVPAAGATVSLSLRRRKGWTLVRRLRIGKGDQVDCCSRPNIREPGARRSRSDSCRDVFRPASR